MLLKCVGEDSWESLGLQGDPINQSKGNQSWIFIGKNDAKSETAILGPSDVKNWLFGKDLEAGKDWGQEEMGMTENEMFGWHHWLDGHELSKLRELTVDREAWRAAVHGFTKGQIWLSNWTELTEDLPKFWFSLQMILPCSQRKWMKIEKCLYPLYFLLKE